MADTTTRTTTLSDSRDASLRGSYDLEAVRYDARRYESTEGRLFNELELRVLRSWLPLGTDAKILDVPAGTGRLSVAIAQWGPRVVGGDISGNMLQMARSKAQQLSASRLQLMQMSGTELPFPDETFDAVLSFKFFHLVPNDRKPFFVREMVRVLKPGGRLIIEFNSPFYGGVLAGLRYYFRKQEPGGMRMKCLFPDQVPVLFHGLEVTRKLGVKLPFASQLSAVIGRRATDTLNMWLGRVPGVRYFLYAIMIEARKPARVSAAA